MHTLEAMLTEEVRVPSLDAIATPENLERALSKEETAAATIWDTPGIPQMAKKMMKHQTNETRLDITHQIGKIFTNAGISMGLLLIAVQQAPQTWPVIFAQPHEKVTERN